MNKLRLVTTAALAALAVMVSCEARAWSISDAFATAGSEIVPLLDRNARLDMIDYFNSGMDRPSDNALMGKSRITEMDGQSMRIRLTDASFYQLAALPAGADTLVAVIATVLTPAPDSRLNIYTRSWEKDLTQRLFNSPVMADWLTADGRRNRDEVEKLVPFLLVGYEYDPDTSTLTLINNTQQALAEEVYEKVRPCLKEKLTYRWNGKKFVALK